MASEELHFKIRCTFRLELSQLQYVKNTRCSDMLENMLQEKNIKTEKISDNIDGAIAVSL